MMMAIARIPFFFGSSQRSLFGCYHAPAPGTERSIAMVICPALGHEQIHSHRSLRHLADRLAAHGVPALRFDYHGTGNSSGSDEETERLGAWLDSICEAARMLRSYAHVSRIGLVGLRMGATLATMASGTVHPACLVLWAPCARGSVYLRELKALRLARGDNESDSTDLEVAGFVVTAETQRDISRLSLEASPPQAGRVLIVARDDVSEDTRLRDAWAAGGLAVEQRALPGYAGMLQEPHKTVVPHAAIGQLVDWITESTAPGTSPPAMDFGPYSEARTTQLIAGAHGSTADVCEAVFGTDTGIRGVSSEPAGGVAASAPTILFANAGATHHIGTNRLYVLLSRALSRSGFRCLRFDLGGLGDSVIDDAASENHPYPATASADVATVIAEIERRHGIGTFVVAGLCSGAHTAFHAALDLNLNASRISECLMINIQTYYYQPNMTLDALSSTHVKRWQWYMKAIRRTDSWSHFIRGGADMSKIAVAARERLGLVARSYSTALLDRPAGGTLTDLPFDLGGALNDLPRDLGALAGSGKKLTFVFSSFEPGHDILMMASGSLVKRLRRQGQLKLWRIKNTNHTFETRDRRNELIETVQRHLVASYAHPN
jgi:alpha/beta superfamily hydrolase